jgi:RNA polymerase sigma-70 factor (ECF subfamily)
VEHDLICRARDGDQEAFSQLYSRCLGWLYFALRGHTRRQQDVEDQAQETFLRAWRELPRLERPELFRAWLRGIALNVARNWSRDRENSQPTFPDLPALDRPAADESTRNEDIDEVRWALSRLTEEDQEILHLRYTLGMTYAACAEVLHLTEATISQRLTRARRRLGRLLRSDPNEY